ncbi:MAG TPA: cell division protein FtsZ [Euryarchaeota archaeon]|nr:cell division protein FtsZ [Euryarchaeota archaeon]
MKSIIDQALARHKKEEEKGPSIPTDSPDDEELKALVESLKVNIKIFGCGGGGSNTVARMNEEGIHGAELVAINTDAQHLLHIHAPKKILIGAKATKGLGAGALPQVGEQAAMEMEDRLRDEIDGAHVVFVTAGMGGGTGTGSASVIARMAKEEGALVMGVVTVPFKAEGNSRMQNAISGLNRLRAHTDTTVVIANDKLLELVPRLPLNAAFKVADGVLMESIKGMTEIVTKPGLVNIDFNDMMTIMKGGGVAMIGIGSSERAQDRVDEAINEAINSPLLGNVDLSDAQGALVRVVGGPDMTISEAQKAVELVGSKINPGARIIWGCSVEDDLEGYIRVLLVITGVKSPMIQAEGHGGSDNIDQVH